MNSKSFLIKLLSTMLTIILCVFLLSSCGGDGDDELSTDTSDNISNKLVGAWGENGGAGPVNLSSLWLFPNGKCYTNGLLYGGGEQRGVWEYNEKSHKLTTSLTMLPDVTISEWTVLDKWNVPAWKGSSDYYGGRLVSCYKRSNESYMEGLWKMIEFQYAEFPITEFRNIRFPENSIIGDCVVKPYTADEPYYYASFELSDPYTDNLRFTISYDGDQLFPCDFSGQTFSFEGKWKSTDNTYD